MEYSIVQKKTVIEEEYFRLDPEFYHPSNLQLEKKLIKKNYSLLGDLCNLYDGPFGSDLLSSSYASKGVPALRMQNITNDGLLNVSNVEYISNDDADNLIKHIAYPGDVVVTKIGFLGFSTVLPKDYDRYFFRREITRLKINDEIKITPHYLATFFNTQHGRQQALRFSSGTTRDRILLVNQRQMIIPIFYSEFQKNIEDICKNAYSAIGESKNIYNITQTLLLSELGLLDWKPKHRLSFVKKYSDTQQAGRFDAEYFQPKYDEIVVAIKNYKGRWDTAENVLNIKDSNILPKHNVEYKYIELANIGINGEIAGFIEAEGQDLPSRARRKVSKDDVIISSIEGSLSSCALIPDEYEGALCSTGFYIVDSTKINPQTLLVLLKSPIGQEQLKKGCSGTILTAINKDEIGKIVLPIVDSGIQHQIKQKIIESFNLRKQSKHLLECAKKAVEMAIEKDEETSMKWLDSQLDDIEMGN